MKIPEADAFGKLKTAFLENQEDDFIHLLHSTGWTRKEITQLCGRLDRESPDQDETFHDAVSNYLTGLIGHCSPDSIVRFPGEPTDREEFLNYVRGLKWMLEEEHLVLQQRMNAMPPHFAIASEKDG